MGEKSQSGSQVKMAMKIDMLTPLNSQKDSAEEGPQAPTGLPTWTKKDPLGIVPEGAGGK